MSGPSAPIPWHRWPARWWIVMASAAAALLALTLALYGERWIALLLGSFAVITPLIAAVDLRWRVIPNRLVLPGAALTLVLAATTGILDGHGERVLGAIAGSAAMFALYLLPALIVPRAMGMGDVKLALMIGGVLGAISWPAWFIGVLAGFVVGALVSILGLVTRRLSWGSSLPFGPAMLAGAWLAIIGAALAG